MKRSDTSQGSNRDEAWGYGVEAGRESANGLQPTEEKKDQAASMGGSVGNI